MSSEIHLFIVWQNGSGSLPRILDDLAANFKIAEHFQVNWSEKHFSRNMTRFYGEHLPSGSFKEVHCGRGPFSAIIVEDMSPVYEKRKTSRGIENVNIRTFDAKSRYRKWTGGGHRIHSTNNVAEAEHDIWLLLHKAPNFFLETPQWDGRCEKFYGDLLGADGWENLQQLFDTLNRLTNYVVLRNFECLPHEYLLEDHGDIDLLTDNLKEMVYVTNASKVFPLEFRVHYHIKINGTVVPFDFRYLGDDYYDAVWERGILENSVFEKDLFYRPNDGDYFFSLLYHALIHKPVFRDDYKTRLIQIGNDIGIDVSHKCTEKYMANMLYSYLDHNFYRMPRPVDLSVFYNQLYINEFDSASTRTFTKAEWRLHEILNTVTDRSTFSEQLFAFVDDPVTEEAFGRSRHCLIRHLPIKAGDTVLEIGCGYGALTRYLGELGAVVTAVERSSGRAHIARERCRDLPNVLNVGNEIPVKNKYSWIFVIGTLADASQYFQSGKLLTDILKAAKNELQEDGRLIIAVENKLGLKYFNGCSEQQYGIPYYGIQGLYDANHKTYGRRELASSLKESDFNYTEFYYPFPDYRSPRVVISDRAMAEPAFDPVELLICCQAKDNIKNTKRLFDDALVFREVSRNGLLADLSNSFLVMASVQPLAEPNESEIAAVYSVGRIAEFAAKTKFVKENNRIGVIKEPLIANLERRTILSEGIILENVLEPAKYVRGSLLLWNLLSARARSGNPVNVIAALTPWFDYLIERSVIVACKHQNGRILINLSDLNVPGCCLDITPFNLVDTGENLVAIDNEWRLDSDIPLGWVVFRSIAHSLSVGAAFPDNSLQLTDVIKSLCDKYGILVSDNELQMFFRLESEFQTAVSGKKSRKIALKRNGMLSGETRDSKQSEFVSQWLDGELSGAPSSAVGNRAQLDSYISDKMANILRLKEKMYTSPPQ